jgi:RhtX/FptX family siderophore transporter
MRKLTVMIACLYLVQGLPLGLAFHAYPTLLRDGGASLEMIAWVPLASLSWVVKFLWAPAVENRWLLSVGRRRSWILPMQAILASCIATMALVPFNQSNAALLLALAALAAFVSATQDIATDALAAERLPSDALGAINTLQVACFMVGMLLGGPGTLIGIGTLGQVTTLLLLVAVVLVCGLPVLFWREPAPVQRDVAKPAALGQFLHRAASLQLLVLGIAATAGGAVLFALVKLILVDAGWELSEVGLIGTVESVLIIVGCFIAYALLAKTQVWQVLLIGLAMVLLAGLLWLGMSAGEGPPAVLPVWLSVVFGGGGIGVTTVASYTLLMRYAQLGVQPGTDFSVFQSFQTLGELVAASAATAIAAQAGYSAGLSLTLGIVVFAVAITLGSRATVQRFYRHTAKA